MTVELVQQILGWCLVLNFGILFLWFGFFMFAHDFVYKIHTKWFKLSVDKFDGIHYATMAFFKLTVFIFNLVPYLALRIVF